MNTLELKNGITLSSDKVNQLFLEALEDIELNSPRMIKNLTLENLELKDLINSI